MNRFSIHFDPEPADEHVGKRWGRLVFGPGYPLTYGIVDSLFGMTMLMVGLVLVRTLLRDWAGPASYVLTVIAWVLFALTATAMVVCGVVRGIAWRRAAAERRLVGEGLAMVVSDAGVETEAGRFTWDQIESVRVDRRGFGWGWHLVIQPDGADAIRLPLIGLDASPATIDLVFRAHSHHRFAVDLRPIDHDVKPRRMARAA